MVLDVGEAEPRRNAAGAAERDIERGLADAIGVALRQHARGAVGLRVGVVDVGVVADAVAHGAIEHARLLDRIGDRCRRPSLALARTLGWSLSMNSAGLR